jgi:zinc transport system permease protein
MIALTVVVLLRIVGMILIIALLTIPAALASQFTYNMSRMMLLAIIFNIIITFGGLWLSYQMDLASGATIVIFGGVILFAVIGFKKIKNTLSERELK